MTFTDRLKAAADLARQLEADIKALRESEQATASPNPADIIVLTTKLCYDCMGPVLTDREEADFWCESCDRGWNRWRDWSKERKGDENQTVQEVPKG